MPKLSNQKLADKISWEGGIFETLEYGLVPDEIEDEHIADLWRDLEILLDKANSLANEIEDLLGVR